VTNENSSRITHDHIQLNTNFRTHANNDFEKNLYKLINNGVQQNHRECAQSRRRATFDMLERKIRRGGNNREIKFPQS